MGSPSANVTSVQALDDFKASIVIFKDTARDALGTLDLEVRKMMDWLEEQAQYWKAEIRRAENQVFQARQELQRRKMMKIGDRSPDTSEQEEELDKAEQRLEYCEEKFEKTRRWQRTLPEDIKEYEGPARNMQMVLESDVPKMIGFLDSKIAALEAYRALQAPSR